MTHQHWRSEVAGWGILICLLASLVLFSYTLKDFLYFQIEYDAPVVPWKHYNPDELVGFSRPPDETFYVPSDRGLEYTLEGVADLHNLEGESLAEVRENICYFLNSLRVKEVGFNSQDIGFSDGILAQVFRLEPVKYNSPFYEDTLIFKNGSRYTPDITSCGYEAHNNTAVPSDVPNSAGLPIIHEVIFYDDIEFGSIFDRYLTGEIPSSDLREFAEAKQLEYEQMKKEIVEQRVNYLLGLLGL